MSNIRILNSYYITNNSYIKYNFKFQTFLYRLIKEIREIFISISMNLYQLYKTFMSLYICVYVCITKKYVPVVQNYIRFELKYSL